MEYTKASDKFSRMEKSCVSVQFRLGIDWSALVPASFAGKTQNNTKNTHAWKRIGREPRWACCAALSLVETLTGHFFTEKCKKMCKIDVSRGFVDHFLQLLVIRLTPCKWRHAMWKIPDKFCVDATDNEHHLCWMESSKEQTLGCSFGNHILLCSLLYGASMSKAVLYFFHWDSCLKKALFNLFGNKFLSRNGSDRQDQGLYFILVATSTHHADRC